MQIIEGSNLLVQSELLRILARLLQSNDVTSFVTVDHLKTVMNLMRSRDTIKSALPVFAVCIAPHHVLFFSFLSGLGMQRPSGSC